MSATFKAFTSSFQRASTRINYYFDRHPVVSNSVLSFNLWIAGDILAQYSEYKFLPKNGNAEKSAANGKETNTPSSYWDRHDWTRTAACASYGALIIGPLLAVWYPFLERLCVAYKVKSRYGLWGAPILKTAADELLMEPPLLVVFFGYMNACEGGSLEVLKTKLQNQFAPSLMTALATWPVLLLGTFRFLPLPMQAPVINVCCIAWDGFLSFRNALEKHEQIEKKSSDTVSQPENAMVGMR